MAGITVKMRTKPANLAKIIDELPRHLRGVATEAAGKALIGPKGGKSGLKHYPPEPPLSQYSRTFNLRRAWMLQLKGAKAKVVNAIAYAGFVQGDNTQAWMHQGRWRTVSMVAADNLKLMVLRADQAIKRHIKSKGL